MTMIQRRPCSSRYPSMPQTCYMRPQRPSRGHRYHTHSSHGYTFSSQRCQDWLRSGRMEAGYSYFLPRLIGMSKAMHLITIGKNYPASYPVFAGLFSETLPDASDVLARAFDIAQDFVDTCSAVSWALNREMMWRNPGTAEGTHVLDSRLICDLFDTQDNT